MTELRIPLWTGVCSVEGKQILGLGNDIYQIGVAIMEGLEKGAVRVVFHEADMRRKAEYGIDGIIDLFPSLRDGVVLRDGHAGEVVDATLVSRHWQMAEYSSSDLRRCLIEFFKPYLEGTFGNQGPDDDVLVIHLRGGDALAEWAQAAWRPSPSGYEFYRDVIERSGLERILIVTTPPENGPMHPLVDPMQRDHGAEVRHGTIVEDYSVLINCANLVLDFSTFGYTAALMNTNLKQVHIPKFIDKKGVPLLKDIRSDVGFTMPRIEGCAVWVYDFPEYVLK